MDGLVHCTSYLDLDNPLLKSTKQPKRQYGVNLKEFLSSQGVDLEDGAYITVFYEI